MSGKKKIVLVLGAAVMVVAALLCVEHIQAWQDYRAALAFPAADQAEVTVTQYATGRTLEELEEGQVSALLERLEQEAVFAGIGSRESSPVPQEAQAYRVVISDSAGYFHSFLIAEQGTQNRLYGDSFVIKLREMPETAQLLAGWFR